MKEITENIYIRPIWNVADTKGNYYITFDLLHNGFDLKALQLAQRRVCTFNPFHLPSTASHTIPHHSH